MRLLTIETSCDETAVTILEGSGDQHGATFTVLGNALLSQIDVHRPYGGVFPALAKREHAKNLVPLLIASLEEAELVHENTQTLEAGLADELTTLLAREPGLAEALLTVLTTYERPAVDAIAVTAGPGLEPALWVGVNFAKALARAWNLPLVASDHMEGHLFSALVTTEDSRTFILPERTLPILALLISGGHTEILLMKNWLEYELVGRTRDDAVGEAFDKFARMLDLPYPGGPEVSRRADADRAAERENAFSLPRPMLHDPSYDFSFSGLKTAALYLVKDRTLSEEEKEQLCRSFEDAATEVLYAKTARALEDFQAQTVAIGGGVSAAPYVRKYFGEQLALNAPQVSFCIPPKGLTGDNAIMIGIAAYFRALNGRYTDPETLVANGNQALA